jgi:hypothetical protein
MGRHARPPPAAWIGQKDGDGRVTAAQFAFDRPRLAASRADRTRLFEQLVPRWLRFNLFVVLHRRIDSIRFAIGLFLTVQASFDDSSLAAPLAVLV